MSPLHGPQTSKLRSFCTVPNMEPCDTAHCIQICSEHPQCIDGLDSVQLVSHAEAASNCRAWIKIDPAMFEAACLQQQHPEMSNGHTHFAACEEAMCHLQHICSSAQEGCLQRRA